MSKVATSSQSSDWSYHPQVIHYQRIHGEKVNLERARCVRLY